ncbi:heat shock protein HspQ [Thiolinea disciformis]|uniref:heat shock protein HspQ n=1 Tax=Thiolinea disciformis TaxID=125614 RepID=UPI0003757763|nr:heat shock protein HspQ [Thiolinea disciformis]
MNKQAIFSIGQVIHHRLFDYRGVIFDVDAEFKGSEEWYEKHTKTGALPRDEPWYHVLIDEDGRVAYVAQRNLESDNSDDPVDHPLLDNFFVGYQDGHYQSRHSIN